MEFWTAIAIIVVVAIVTEFVVRIVKIGTKYSENIERIKHGYPTLNGDVPINAPKAEDDEDFRGTSLASNAN